MKKIFCEAFFRGIYSKTLDKVVISYSGSRVMNITNVSKNYDIEGLNGMQIAEKVFEDNKKIASDIVKDNLFK